MTFNYRSTNTPRAESAPLPRVLSRCPLPLPWSSAGLPSDLYVCTPTELEPGDHSQYSLADFELIRVIGRGSYAKVLMVELKRTKRVYAMKVSGSNPAGVRLFLLICLLTLDRDMCGDWERWVSAY